MDIIKRVLPFVLILGFVSIIVYANFGLNNNLVQTITVNGITFKTLDLNMYVKTLSVSFDASPLDFNTIIPTRQFDNGANNGIDLVEWAKTINNNGIYLMDLLFIPLNFGLYILRAFCYLAQMILTLLAYPKVETGNLVNGWANNLGGTNTHEYTSQLQTILEWCKYNLFVPYM